MVLAVMVGCSATPITPSQERIQIAQETTEIACYNQMIDHDVAMMEALVNVPKNQIAFVVMMLEQQENSKEMMALATGRTYNPCAAGSSVFDVQIAELKEKNQYATSATASALSIGKWIVGGWAVSTIIDKATGDAYNYVASDNAKVNVGSQNTGSYNTASGKDSNVNTQADGTVYNNNEEKNIDSDRTTEESEEIEEGGDLGMCGDVPLVPNNQPGDWVSGGCSCDSYLSGHCTP